MKQFLKALAKGVVYLLVLRKYQLLAEKQRYGLLNPKPFEEELKKVEDMISEITE